MADILSSLLKARALKVTSRVTGMDVLTSCAIVKVSFKFISQPLEHRMESGAVKIDARIVRATRVSIDLLAPDADALDDVNNVILDRTSLYLLTSKGIQVDNMKIAPAFMTQTANNTSSTPIRLEFVQTLLENVDPIIFQYAADSSIIERGIASINTATEGVTGLFDKVTSVASRGVDVASDLFSRVFNR